MLSQTEFYETRIKPRQENLKDSLVIQDQGHSVWTKTPEAQTLSKGCQACKTGTWMCIYVGSKCNASCQYCTQGSMEDKNARHDDEQATRYMSLRALRHFISLQAPRVTGISYSGGEPLLYLAKIANIAEYVLEHNPSAYQWLYTNGLLLNEESLAVLRDLNIQEIRVHLGAFDFSDEIIEKMRLAAKYIRYVNVETPATLSAREHLLGKGKIHVLEDMGVNQINLGELMIRCALNQEYVGDAEVYQYGSETHQAASPVFSREITYDIMDYAVGHKLNMIINDCSNQAKSWQQYMCKKNHLQMQC